jgi:glutamyl-tRNA reductase
MFVQSFRFSCSRPTQTPGWPLCVERLVVAIRLLPLYRKGVEVVTSTEVDSQPVLYSEVSGTIASLREHFEVVRRSEIHRVRGRLGNLSSDQEDVVESLSRSIIEKVLQSPVAMLLNATAANQSAFIVKTVRRIFNLPT